MQDFSKNLMCRPFHTLRGKWKNRRRIACTDTCKRKTLVWLRKHSPLEFASRKEKCADLRALPQTVTVTYFLGGPSCIMPTHPKREQHGSSCSRAGLKPEQTVINQRKMSNKYTPVRHLPKCTTSIVAEATKTGYTQLSMFPQFF